MAYEEDKTRLRRQSSKQAVGLAMQGRWREAIVANEELLENFPNDVDAYNRLGRAHMELGEYAKARKSYEKAIELDAYNLIAKKNLTRLSHISETHGTPEGGFHKVEPLKFIEEVGKAGVVSLLRLAPAAVVAKATAGDPADLKVDGSMLTVTNTQGEYLGQVDPRNGQRLLKLMEGGNKYSANIVSAADDAVTVIIRETFQDASQVGKLSFPPKGAEPARGDMADRMIRRKLEMEEQYGGETGYAVVGSEGEEGEFIPGDTEDSEENDEDADVGDEMDSEE